MTKIISRRSALTEDQLRHEIKVELAAEVALELDALVEKLDSFLELRITQEFEELRQDILTVNQMNKKLLDENAHFRNVITDLSLQLLSKAII